MAVGSEIHAHLPPVVIDERPRSAMDPLLAWLFLALFVPILVIFVLGQLIRILGVLVIGLAMRMGEQLERVYGPRGPGGALVAAIIRVILGIRVLDSDNPPTEPPSAPPAAPLPIPVPSTGPRRDGSDARVAPIDLP